MSPHSLLTGRAQAPAAGGPPRQLVILLHGYGADGADLIGLAPFFARALPHDEFLAPNAPEPCDMGFGFQWSPPRTPEPSEIIRGIGHARPLLDAFIEAELAERSLGPESLALIGF